MVYIRSIGTLGRSSTQRSCLQSKIDPLTHEIVFIEFYLAARSRFFVLLEAILKRNFSITASVLAFLTGVEPKVICGG